jgi:1,4-dihydroxy-2-naphthoate octaprenyltransferase
VLTVAVGLGSSLGYALHDYLMVKVVRAAAVWTALTWSMGTGLVILLPLALASDGLPRGSAE